MKAFTGLSILAASLTGIGLILLILWGNSYNYQFGSCQIIGYSIGPGMLCQWSPDSPICGTSFCSSLEVSLLDSSTNTTTFIPMAFDNNPYNCWSSYSYSDLKGLLLQNYPLNSIYTCYSNNNDNSYRLSTSSFYQFSRGVFFTGLFVFLIGFVFGSTLFSYTLYMKCKNRNYEIL